MHWKKSQRQFVFLSKKISSLKFREDICIIYSTFLYYFPLAFQHRAMTGNRPQIHNHEQISLTRLYQRKSVELMVNVAEPSGKMGPNDAGISNLIIFKRYFIAI